MSMYLRFFTSLLLLVFSHPQAIADNYTYTTGVKLQSGSLTAKSVDIATDSIMTQVKLSFNNKTLWLLSGNDELYLKLINSDGAIAFIENNDLAAIADLAKKINASTTQAESKEVLLKTLELLYSWPVTIPVYQWKDSVETVSPLKDQIFVVKAVNQFMAKSALNNVDQLYDTTDINLIAKLSRDFPQINSVDSEIIAKKIIPKSADLCNAIGSAKPATYPDSVPVAPAVSGPANSITWKTSGPKLIEPWWNEGGSCIGRCGQGCSGTYIGGPASNTDVYSDACFNHDMCADDKGIVSAECNYILPDAVSDYLQKTDCTSLDISGPDTVTTNSTNHYITYAHIGSLTYDISTFPGLEYTYACSETGCPVDSWSGANGLITKDFQPGTYYSTLTATFKKHGLTRTFDKKVTVITGNQ